MGWVRDALARPHASVTEAMAPVVSTTLARTCTVSPAAGGFGLVRTSAIRGAPPGGAEPLCEPGLALVASVTAVAVHSEGV
jgi:hypothetical protein